METTKHSVTSKTKELLAKLNNVMSQSNLVQEIAEKSETLWNLEQKVGPSEETRELRNEIARLEDLLRTIRQ